jgi:preprotein translocase subunit SecF
MQFIKPGININFIGKRKIAFALSLAMILISIGSLLVNRGPRYGIDFAGGTLVQVKFDASVPIDQIKSGLATMELAASAVQQFGQADDHEYLIRTDATNPAMEGLSEKIEKNLKEATNVAVEIRRVEMVGPQVGQDLREKALFAMFYALLLITVYISGRFELKWAMSGIVAAAIMGSVYLLSLFHVSVPFLMLAALIVSLVIFWFFEFKYAMGAIVALIHDVTITVGMFSIFDKEFTLPIVAALLTIIGYSLNDTIIVFDRIRENLRKYHKEPLTTILNKSINETLSRTILTSGTTMIVVVALFILGGGIIHDFSFALMIGVLVGTYSSIFVASPILLAWQTRRK